MTFNELHKNSYPLILCNVWDVVSAKAAEGLAIKLISIGNCLFTNMTTMLKHNPHEIMKNQSFEIIYNYVN